ncbi:hypothetical protein AX774_g6520 [Zancudomyces culisetae]|uniref:Carbohydrate-binding module family 19 domain-containing protein n=1 Tax=Zancudomyces culisetae TaxID=1213189 RepID=A0A1R1PEM1_ZANCU|nr:hypothetical protein AX774_g7140 [Zancudomyces culisetae]OMH80046.1 hypothetical protein AX774_g6520 [Zancudomyces culisetae]|eukprot:OMH79440.1 hypothetical protein AX774_g7140 [Zancudomyces culisetae]
MFKLSKVLAVAAISAIANLSSVVVMAGDADYNQPAQPYQQNDYDSNGGDSGYDANQNYDQQNGYVQNDNGYDQNSYQNGGKCYGDKYKCIGQNNPGYLQCDHGTFILRQCGPGTVCVQNGRDSIYCGYPQKLY